MEKIDLKNKKISVMGAARSGKALARVLTAHGAKVLVSESKTQEQLSSVMEELAHLDLEWETGGHTSRIYKGRDMVIISPGVSIKSPILQESLFNGVPVISEVEMAFYLARAPFIAITGTNGKSTTSTLVHEILLADGKKSFLAGNIGVPLVEEVEKIPADAWIVAEISSFQLEAVKDFHPRIAAILNVTDDHQDRHESMDEYLTMKARIFQNHTQADVAVFNAEDHRVAPLADSAVGGKLFFSRVKPVKEGAYMAGDAVKIRLNGEEKVLFQWKDVPLKGVHNRENVLAAACITTAAGVRPKSIYKALKAFKPLHYRMEYVDSIKGIEFYNDSKGTNPDAVRASLVSFEKPVVIIAGGTDKGLDFKPLAQNIKNYADGAVLIGESRTKIASALEELGYSNFRVYDDMSLEGFKDSIELAWKMCPPGGVVLLSPSCASFDMFNRAEHRGEMFDKYVRELKQGYEETV